MELKDVLTEVKDTVNANNDALVGKIDGVKAEVDDAKSQISEMYVSAQRPGGSGFTQPAKSIGEQFVESDEFKNVLSSKNVNSAPLELKSLHGPATKDLSSGADSGGALVEPQRVPQVVTPPDRSFRMRDLFRVQTTTSNAIEYVQETGFTNNAAFVAEGGLKPTSDLTYGPVTVPVRTLAHAIIATRQILNDAPQLQGNINGRLIYGIKLVEEQQCLYGDGQSENLSGILTDANRQQRLQSSGEATDTVIDIIRRAMTDVELAEYEANGIIMHPRVWEQVELLKDANENYMRAVTVDQAGRPFLFGKPIVSTPAIMETDVAVGAFDLAADLWDREQANVRTSDSHGETFLRNQLTILGEERVALCVVRPEAFVHVTLDGTGGTA